jgi:hypothetical protein
MPSAMVFIMRGPYPLAVVAVVTGIASGNENGKQGNEKYFHLCIF